MQDIISHSNYLQIPKQLPDFKDGFFHILPNGFLAYLRSVRQKQVDIKQDDFAYAQVFSLPFLIACPWALLDILVCAF